MTLLHIGYRLLLANLRGELQYRANFLVAMVDGLLWDCIGFLVIWVVLSRFVTIGGWTLGEMAFLYGWLLLTASITTLIFSFSETFETLVREGTFDRYLVRPLPPLLQLITSRFHVDVLGPLVGALAIFLLANAQAHVDWSPAALLYLVLAMAGSCLLQAATHLAICALSFRLLSTGMLSFMIADAARYGFYPLRIFSQPVRWLLTLGLPVAFMGYFPSTVLLGRTGELYVPPAIAYLAPLAGVVWFVPAYLYFHHEIGHYQSAGH